MQLDIFEHGRAVMLRNDAAHALERRDASAARQACNDLSQEYPADDSLPALRVLTGYIEAAEFGRDVADRWQGVTIRQRALQYHRRHFVAELTIDGLTVVPGGIHATEWRGDALL